MDLMIKPFHLSSGRIRRCNRLGARCIEHQNLPKPGPKNNDLCIDPLTLVKCELSKAYRENDGSSGSAVLIIRYSGKQNGAKGKFVEIKNNGKVVVKKLFLPNTDNYGSHWKSVKVKIPNHAGANTIRITNLGQGGMCIDEVDVLTAN